MPWGLEGQNFSKKISERGLWLFHTEKECLNQLWNNSCKPDGLKFIAKKFDNTEDVDAHLEKEGKRYGPDGDYGSKSYGQIGSEVQIIEQNKKYFNHIGVAWFSYNILKV